MLYRYDVDALNSVWLNGDLGSTSSRSRRTPHKILPESLMECKPDAEKIVLNEAIERVKNEKLVTFEKNVVAQMRMEIREKNYQEVMKELRKNIADEAKSNAKKKELEELRASLKQDVKHEVEEAIRPDIEARVRQEYIQRLSAL